MKPTTTKQEEMIHELTKLPIYNKLAPSEQASLQAVVGIVREKVLQEIRERIKEDDMILDIYVPDGSYSEHTVKAVNQERQRIREIIDSLMK